MLNFISGAYYVKLNGFDLGATGAEVLRSLAEKIAASINGSNTLPAALAAFPAANKVARSERYFTGNFLGHDFLGAAFSADYETKGKRCKLFIMKTASAAGLPRPAAALAGPGQGARRRRRGRAGNEPGHQRPLQRPGQRLLA